MGQSCGKNGRLKTGKGIRCTERERKRRGGKLRTRMDYCVKRDVERVGRGWRTTAKIEEVGDCGYRAK